MKEIQAESVNFRYFYKEDGLTDKNLSEANLLELDLVRLSWNKIEANGLSDVRLILFEYPFRPRVKHIRFLHWDDGTDLISLDRKVADNTFADADFINSVITIFGKTKCLVCDWIGDTLAMELSDAYVGYQGLEERKIGEHKFHNCPNCGARLSRLVAKIFGGPRDN